MPEKLILGKFEEVRNGVPLKYTIQTVTPELTDDIVQHMVDYFLKREPITSYDRILDDKVSLENFLHIWKDTINQGNAMVAIEQRDDDQLNIIGANITYISEKDKQEVQNCEGKVLNKVLKVMKDITEKGNIYEKYDVDKYLSAFGLSVHPNYHGYKIGSRLLECRKPLCKALGLEATGTVFSANAAQYIAGKVGFETLVEENFDTYEIDGELAYPGLPGKLTYMGLKYSH